MQKGAIDEESFRIQLAQVELKERRAEFDVQEKSTSLQNDLKEKELKLRQKVAATAQEVADNEGWSVVLDKHAPGVLYVKSDTDGTPQLLKACDKKYEAELAKSVLAKDDKKSA